MILIQIIVCILLCNDGIVVTIQNTQQTCIHTINHFVRSVSVTLPLTALDDQLLLRYNHDSKLPNNRRQFFSGELTVNVQIIPIHKVFFHQLLKFPFVVTVSTIKQKSCHENLNKKGVWSSHTPNLHATLNPLNQCCDT